MKKLAHKRVQGFPREALGDPGAKLDQGVRPSDLSSGCFPLKQALANYGHWPNYELRMIFTLLNG